MDFLDWYTIGVSIAVSLVIIVGGIYICCFSETTCIDIIIPSCVAVSPGKRRRAAGMVFDTCSGEEGADGGCAICLSEYEAGERRATISDCTHRFHAGCIETWIKRNSTCPLCRHNLV